MAMRFPFPLRIKVASVIFFIAITLGGLVGCGGSDTDTYTDEPPVVATTGSKVLSWFERIADFLYEVARGLAAVAEGNVPAGAAEFAAAGLGLIGKGLEGDESGDEQAKQLTEIDGKLDTLLIDVQAIASQLSDVENKLDNIQDYWNYIAAMKGPMDKAQTWLDSNYTNENMHLRSREWVRWYMAGCNPTMVGSCPSADNPVNADRLATFRQTYIKNPTKNPMTNATDNFPLWWAYSVIGDQTTGAGDYRVDGTNARDIVTEIYQGLTNEIGKDTNGLISYMNYWMTKGNCASDVTDPKCDLFNDVYLPLETYFSLAVGRQSQLVMALAEAYAVLAHSDSDAYGKAGDDLMAGFNKQLNVEVESFLQAAEQIAIYRIADGRTDWSNFAETDAGKLLARADFVAAQLAGKNYRTEHTTPEWTAGYVNPPWPSNGIVGRVFYAQNEDILTENEVRWVCSNANPSSCILPLANIGENPLSRRTINDAPPYLWWERKTDSNGAVTMTGTSSRTWTVLRLNPLSATTLPIGTYLVDSANYADRMPATLSVNNYDENFFTPPEPDTSSVIPFGSFSSVEGAVGRYGLKLDTKNFIAHAKMNSTLFDDTYSVSADIPGAVSYNVKYKINEHFDARNWDGLGPTAGTWSATITIKLDIQDREYRSVKLSWPSTFHVYLDSKFDQIYNLLGPAGREEYYSYVKSKLEILNKGKSVGSLEHTHCDKVFQSCYIEKGLPFADVTLTAASVGDLTYKANFSTEVDQYTSKGLYNKRETVRTSTGASYARLELQAPTFTLIK